MKNKAAQSALILLFSGLCLANILAGIFPKDSETGKSLGESLAPFRWSTGTWQRWDMFRSIPTLHRVEFKLVAVDESGSRHEFGAGLPSFFTVEPRESIRYHYTFLRLLESDPEFLDGYVQAVEKALLGLDPEAYGGEPFVEFSIEVESETTRHLFHIRKDGELTKSFSNTFGPYAVGDDA